MAKVLRTSLQCHTLTSSRSFNACRRTASDVNVMDVIYFLVFFWFFLVECAWVADHKQYIGLRDSSPQIPRSLGSPFLLNPPSPFSQSPLLTDPPFSLCAMAPPKTKRPPEPSSNAKASRRPVRESRNRSKVTFLGPLRILGSETTN